MVLPPRTSKAWNGRLFNVDAKHICAVCSSNAPLELPKRLDIVSFNAARAFDWKPLPLFQIMARGESDYREWDKLLTFLVDHSRVAVINVGDVQLLLKPPGEENEATKKIMKLVDVAYRARPGPVKRPIAQMHPEYLTTLSQTHSSWLFGAVAELIDNACDAGAKRLEISIQKGTLKSPEVSEVPMLCFLDDGLGMTHKDIVKMVSFGHKKPEQDDPEQIGRFGVGFKTGVMRLGRGALVLTQSKETRSMALLSTGYNEGKDVLEVPIVTYTRRAGRMDIDTGLQTLEDSQKHRDVICTYGPFDEYGIGAEFQRLEGGTGTIIYVFDLEKWGSSFSLDWNESDDIMIRSRRVRSRPGQTSPEVPLDYSLRAYVEVMFLEPRMIVSIQGKKVTTKCLAKTLNSTWVTRATLMGKPVQLTLGVMELERKRGNCGIFLYWHGRLVESYKRVGNMVHSAEWGRGVIGVVETTKLMEFDRGRVGVLNSKQGFEDCEMYAALEKWLGEEADKYWETRVEKLTTEEKEGLAPDKSWVQCSKCLKWRVMDPEWHGELPDHWFCYMAPYKGSCNTPEENVEDGVVTTKTSRGTAVRKNTRGKEGSDITDSSKPLSRLTSKTTTNSPKVKRTSKRTKKE
ncbi:MORC family CW-type zinc finger protein 3 [Selaginella moellendorffii]|nr:MORC family CW-type zinc finger protein 3 [Selaginella moellendorffii]|eukprot:XP_002986649.2 MORC family CW-type zinc finger protein 3 [Selaginella moellendorffii]